MTHLDPPHSSIASRILPFFIVAAVLATVGAVYWQNPPYSPDTWAYYELSQSLRNGQYSLLQLRTFGDTTHIGPATSFPPLWPALWAAAATITGLGARAGLLLNLVLVAAFIGISERVGRTLTSLRWVGIAAALIVVRMAGLWDEVVGARAIPLQLFLASVSLLVLLRTSRIRVPQAAVIGALSGALIMTRFDMLPYALTMAFGIVFLSRSARAALAYVLALLIVISPWIWMSHHFYGTWFASDNSRVALSVDPTTYVRDWFPDGTGPASAREQPIAWLHKLLRNCVRLLMGVARSPGRTGLIFFAVAAVLVVFNFSRKQKTVSMLSAQHLLRTTRPTRAFAVFGFSVLSMLPLYVLSGYFDSRYFSLLNWVAALSILWLLVALWRNAVDPNLLQQIAAVTAVACAAILLASTLPMQARVAAQPFPEVQGAAALKTCLASDAQPAQHVMTMDGLLAARLSAVHAIPTTFTPSNFERVKPTDDVARTFFRNYGITHVVGSAQEIAAMFNLPLFTPVARDCGFALYRVNR